MFSWLALSSLPTPTELTLAGTGLIVAGGLAVWFLPAFKRIGVYAILAGGLILFAASVAAGYKQQGIDEIMPKLQACEKKIEEANALAENFRTQAVAAVARLEAATKAKRDAINKLTADFNARLAAQDEQIRNLRIPAAAGQLLQPAIDAANVSAGLVTQSSVDAAASAAVAGDTTLAAVEQWAGEVTGLYANCATQVAGLQQYVDTLVKNSAQLQPVR